MTMFLIGALIICALLWYWSARKTIACIDVSGSISKEAFKAAVKMARWHGHKYIMFYSSDYTKPQWFSRKLYNSIVHDDATPTIFQEGTDLSFLASDPYYKNRVAHIYTDGEIYEVPNLEGQRVCWHYVRSNAL